MATAWDILLDDETYLLLEEWYGKRIELSTAIQNIDREGIIRLLDQIIEDASDTGEDEMVTRAKEAKGKLV